MNPYHKLLFWIPLVGFFVELNHFRTTGKGYLSDESCPQRYFGSIAVHTIIPIVTLALFIFL